MNNLKPKFNFINFDEIDSTNVYVKNNYKKLQHLTVVTANFQSAGRGRLGKNFVSPKGTGAYFSLLLKENISPENSKFLTVMAAVAVAETIEHITSKQVKIKWVNDVYIEGKKVCGILTEGLLNSQNNTFKYAVIGIGINLITPQNGFPDEISEVATALFGNTCSDERKNEIINEILYRFYDMFYGKDTTFIDRYREKSFLNGKKIDIIKGNSTESDTALYIDENCNLVARKETTGDIIHIFSGDVSIKT